MFGLSNRLVLGVIRVLAIELRLTLLRIVWLLFGGSWIAEVLHFFWGAVFSGARIAFSAPTPPGALALSSVFGRLFVRLVAVLLGVPSLLLVP